MSKPLLNLLLVVVSVAMYYVVISPVYYGGGSVFAIAPENSIVQMRDFQNKSDNAIVKLTEGKEGIDNLSREYASFGDNGKDTINTMIPNSIDPIRLVSEINKIVLEEGLKAENIAYTKDGDDKKLSGVGVYSITFSTKCSYQDMKELLSKLQTSMRLFSIQSVGFSSPEKPNDPMAVTIKMKTYYIK